MNIEAQNIEEMFAAAATAAEDTGEGNVGGKEEVKKVEPKVETKPKETPKAVEPKPEPKPEPKVEEKQPEPKVETKPEPEKEVSREPEREPEREPLVSSKERGIIHQGISEDSIYRILEMNALFNKFSDTEKKFVSKYFGIDPKDESVLPKVIYETLTADRRSLDALNKIVVARNETPAERAFYLMDLDNNSIEAIYEQVDLLTGDLGNTGRVNNENKIKVCRAIEASISSMPNDVFAYIDKLQSFANKALS